MESENTFRCEVTKKQLAFLRCEADEVLFGGAAGGGKSFAQVLDCLVYALRWPGSRQLLLRRTMPELERTLLRTARALWPAGLYRWSAVRREAVFGNGAAVEFGYCGGLDDARRYQSAEYDVIRFDELTHFSEEEYLLLRSRLRGAAPRPRALKSATNPGGPGHDWVRRRFVDPAPPGTVFSCEGGSRVFLPARVSDNVFLLRADPGYPARLASLPEEQRRALLDGEWDLRAGRYFSLFRREKHVVPAFAPPAHWTRVLALDYGLDMLACLFLALDDRDGAYVYREVYAPDLIVSAAAARILASGGGEASLCLAPPDLWNRRQETGRSAAELFCEAGLPLVRAPAARVSGWLALLELLRDRPDGTPRLRVCDSCVNLIRTLPALQRDPADPNDCARTPHELTHAPDALRYFAAYWRPGPAAGTGAAADDGLAALLGYGRG